MIWLIGMAAVVLSSKRTRLLRPALVVVAAAIISGDIPSDATISSSATSPWSMPR